MIRQFSQTYTIPSTIEGNYPINNGRLSINYWQLKYCQPAFSFTSQTYRQSLNQMPKTSDLLSSNFRLNADLKKAMHLVHTSNQNFKQERHNCCCRTKLTQIDWICRSKLLFRSEQVGVVVLLLMSIGYHFQCQYKLSSYERSAC